MLVAGPDFGTGSSREHAVWALKDYGFRVVLSSRFADIFRGNSGKQGLLAAQVAQDDIELIWKILESHPGTEVTVDLEAKTAHCQDVTVPFQVDDYTRWRLLEGLDDIGLTMQHDAEISRVRADPRDLAADDAARQAPAAGGDRVGAPGARRRRARLRPAVPVRSPCELPARRGTRRSVGPLGRGRPTA